MHADPCPVCQRLDRPKAFRYLGIQHFIPATHGAKWLGEDLRATLAGLDLGAEVRLDYGADDAPGPRLAVRRDHDGGLLVAELGAGDSTGASTPWKHLGESEEGGNGQAVYEILNLLKERRGAFHVIIVPQRD